MLPPLSLYIHIPWCEKKCPYCDFNSHLTKTQINESLYIKQLVADFESELTRFGNSLANRTVDTVFIGGGTPSLFSSASFKTLLDEIARRINFASDCEITLEANPGSSEAEKFSTFRDAGINRLSIGVQSFDAQQLKNLGRIHDSGEAINAASYARQAGFDNFNLDIMFGLPKQTTSEAIEDIKQAIALEPTHLSCYQLTIEPNTLFHHNPPITPDDDLLWQMQSELQTRLSDKGYTQYEVSAYAQNGKRCKHNLNYWRFGDYIGIGAGAHGKVTTETGEVIRRWKIKHPATYIQKADKLGGETQVPISDLAFEFMLNALRLREGFSIEQFEQRTLQHISSIADTLQQHIELKLIERHGDTYKPTQFGYNQLNRLLEDYLQNAQKA